MGTKISPNHKTSIADMEKERRLPLPHKAFPSPLYFPFREIFQSQLLLDFEVACEEGSVYLEIWLAEWTGIEGKGG